MSLRQMKLGFTPLPKKSDASPLSSSPKNIPPVSKSQKSAKGLSKRGRSRGAPMECIELPPPPKRGLRADATSIPHSSRSSLTKADISAQSRKPSLKRKCSPTRDANAEHSTEIVHVPYIFCDQKSYPIATGTAPATQSSREDNRVGPGSRRNGPAPLKRLRTSSPLSELTPLPPSTVFGTDLDLDRSELIPTSQSDEQELTLPRVPEKDPVEVQKNVDRWRRETLANPPSRTESPSPQDEPFYSPFSELNDMDVDFDLPPPSDPVPQTPIENAPPRGIELLYPQTPCSASRTSLSQLPSSASLPTSASAWATPVSHFETPSSIATGEREAPLSGTSPSDACRSLTPPSSPDTDTEPVVRALDEKRKTEILIAEIMARAKAAAHSSPEPAPADLDSFDDSDADSDSSEDVFPALTKDTMGKSKATATITPVKAGPSKPAPEPTPRYNLRRSSPSGPKAKAKQAAPAAPARKQPRKTDPLAALLREKDREERAGTGMAAIRLAEQALIAQAKSDLQDEADGEQDSSDDGMDWESEQAAQAARGTRRGNGKSIATRAEHSRKEASGVHESEAQDESDVEDDAIKEIDYQEFLGEKDGKAVGKILESDMKEEMAKRLASQSAEPLGVPLWATPAEHDDGMVVESSVPLFTAQVGENTVLQLLKDATAQNDVAQVSALLTSGFVAFLRPEQWIGVVPWLLDTAFSDVRAPLASLAYTQLLRLAPHLGQRSSGLRLPALIKILVRLGASLDVLHKHGCKLGEDMVLQKAANSQWGDEMVYRLVTIVDAYAKTFVADDLSDLFFVIILVGMDPTTSDALRTEVRRACDSLAPSMSLFQEVAVCEKVFAFGHTLSPINQSFLVSIMSGTTPEMSRMTRCVARSLLLKEAPSNTEHCDALPSLLPLLDLLSPRSGSGEYFDVSGKENTKGYYDDLTCRLSLLSRALSDIDEYTAAEVMEKRAAQHVVRSEGEVDKEKDKEKDTVLQLVKKQLDQLHGKIVDTRAAHLDRSRAKAALQRLSLRVHYQRLAMSTSGVDVQRPPTLLSYFHHPA